MSQLSQKILPRGKNKTLSSSDLRLIAAVAVVAYTGSELQANAKAKASTNVCQKHTVIIAFIIIINISTCHYESMGHS